MSIFKGFRPFKKIACHDEELIGLRFSLEASFVAFYDIKIAVSWKRFFHLLAIFYVWVEMFRFFSNQIANMQQFFSERRGYLKILERTLIIFGYVCRIFGSSGIRS
ncbi:hypothetical protein [Bartonella sp. MR30HLJHH]|uniref:hypothetical protein n=1 Tax=Bartonella sp. MR30HLJHH TaxID=3243557 RepID=UPI0035CFE8C1